MLNAYIMIGKSNYIWNKTYEWIIFISLCMFLKPTTCGKGGGGNKVAKIDGDIVLGGLFPVHKKSENQLPCGEIQADRGIQRLEAMLFTIDYINNNTDILPHIILGANILDTCSRDTYALEESLEYVRGSMSSFDETEYICTDGSKPTAQNAPVAVAGVIGGSYSSVSIQVANLLRLFKIPQVSYASTSAALSDKGRFDLFARTVPPDNYQAKAMVDIVQFFNWTYVSTVASEGEYGENGIYSFQNEATARNICIALSEKIPQSATALDFENVITSLKRKPNARVIILFLRVEDAKNLLTAATKIDPGHAFVWVASDGWGTQEMPVKENLGAASGAITIELKSSPLPDFDDYFKSLNPLTNTRNPWFKEYWEHIHDCKLMSISNDRNITITSQKANFSAVLSSQNVRQCTGNEPITRKQYTQESKIRFVHDAVLSMALAIDNMIKDKCLIPTKGKKIKKRKIERCIKKLNIDGAVLYKTYLLNVSFTDDSGEIVKFDEQGDGVGRYHIFNYRRDRETGKYHYVTVGEWNNGGLIMNSSEKLMFSGGTYDIPWSQCSQPCLFDQIKRVQQGDTCCWICTTCEPWQYVKDEFNCMDCEDGWWPHVNKTGCYKLPQQYMRWDSLFAIIPVCLSIVGIILTCIVMVTFIIHIDTPVVKASGREVSFVLLAGFLVCYSMTFFLLAKPTIWSCAIHRFGIGLGFSMTYASLLTKTNRISRIFESARSSARRPPFISPKSQVVITLLLIGIQIAVTVAWFVLEPPGVRLYNPNGQKDQIVLKCLVKDESFLISLTYNILLIITCTVYAVKTRKIPENFNESKFIGFTMYTTCIIWLAFVPIYFGTLNSFHVQITTLCVSISLSAFVGLLCLFTPKMYIIVFQPQKNVRKLTMNSTTYKTPTASNFSNHLPPEKYKMNNPNCPLKMGSGGATTDDTDKDSLNSITL